MRRPQIGMIRHRRVSRTEPLRRSVEQAKTIGGDAGDNLRRYPTPRPSFSHTQHAAGSSHRSQHRISIQRLYRSEIDDLYLVPVLGQFVGCGQATS